MYDGFLSSVFLQYKKCYSIENIALKFVEIGNYSRTLLWELISKEYGNKLATRSSVIPSTLLVKSLKCYH